MDTNRNDGGPAFARPMFDNENFVNQEQDGMSLEDYFAAAALTGKMAAWTVGYDGPEKFEAVAISCWKMARKMIELKQAAMKEAEEKTP